MPNRSDLRPYLPHNYYAEIQGSYTKEQVKYAAMGKGKGNTELYLQLLNIAENEIAMRRKVQELSAKLDTYIYGHKRPESE